MYLRGTAGILRINVKVKDYEVGQRQFCEFPLIPLEDSKYAFTGKKKTSWTQIIVDSVEEWLSRVLVLLVHHFLGQLGTQSNVIAMSAAVCQLGCYQYICQHRCG